MFNFDALSVDSIIQCFTIYWSKKHKCKNSNIKIAPMSTRISSVAATKLATDNIDYQIIYANPIDIKLTIEQPGEIYREIII